MVIQPFLCNIKVSVMRMGRGEGGRDRDDSEIVFMAGDSCSFRGLGLRLDNN